MECKLDEPHVYCPGCQHRLYHSECFDKAKRHRQQPKSKHPGRDHKKLPIKLLKELNYINTPNERTSISDEEIMAAMENQFIRLDLDGDQTLTFGPRADPLLRPPHQESGESLVFSVGVDKW